MIQLAVESSHVLARHFWAALVRGGGIHDNDDDAALLRLPMLAGACPISAQGQTAFYFDTTTTTTTTTTESSSCPASLDWYILAYLVLGVHAISWGLRWFVWEPALRRLGTPNKNLDAVTGRKISMYLTECAFFLTSAIFAYRLFAKEWWLYQPDQWLQGRDTYGHSVSAAVKFYYLLYAARFISDFISLFFEIGRTATTLAVSCLHHTVTLGLIAVAIRGNYIRAAAVIMFFFDWADPPLLLAKTCKYLSDNNANSSNGANGTMAERFQTAANRLFEIFAVTFFLSRNVLYNYVTYHFIVHLPANAVWEITCLLALVALQTYWLVLIIQAAMRQQANNGRVEDVREQVNRHDDDDDDDGKKNKNKKTQ